MERPRPLLVIAFICILLAGKIVVATSIKTIPAASSSSIVDQDSTIKEPVQLVVYGVIEGNKVFFNWSQTAESSTSTYRIRYNTHILECPARNNWKRKWGQPAKPNSHEISAKPYTNVTLQVKSTTTKTAVESVVTPAKEPTTKVTVKLIEGNSYIGIRATLSPCSEYNGPDMYVQFVLKVTNDQLQKLPKDIEKKVSITNGKAELSLNDLDLLPFTTYSVTAIPGNRIGRATNSSLFGKINFTTDAASPGKVNNLTVVNVSHDVIEVNWTAPDDDPPKGILERYVVYWEMLGNASGQNTNETSNTSLVIRGLQPNTRYNITVKAKNKKASALGEAAHIYVNTTEDTAPSPVDDLKVMAETNTTLHLSWNASKIGPVDWYMISLDGEESVRKNTTTTSTTVEFDHLSAGTKYTVTVKACRTGGKCSNTTEIEAWTMPDPPIVEERKQSLAPTDDSIIIQLPILKNPPGIKWVLLKKDGSGRGRSKEETEDIKKKAENAVRRYNEKPKETVRPPNTTVQKRDRRSVCTVSENCELRIVKKIYVNGIGNQEYVTLGGDEKSKLERDSDYTVVIVMETRAGDKREYSVCDPIKFKTQASKEEMGVLGLIAGICAAAVVMAAAVIVLLVYCTNRRKKLTPVRESVYFMEGSVFIDIVQENDKVPLKDGMNGKILEAEDRTKLKEDQQRNDKHGLPAFREDMYVNINQEVKEKHLEMYLPKAMFSTETTMEFKSVPLYMPGKKVSDSCIPENVAKNRYRNEVCYDDTRVMMPLFNKIPHSDYINANFVKDSSGYARFIATQGPKDVDKNTIGAFWRMIWHTKCSMILMVANLVEGGRIKVAQYWPEKQPLVNEGVKVTLTSTRIVMDFVVRTFTLVVNDMKREVTQYQYTAWPDHGVPQTAYGLGHMLKIVIRDYKKGPGGPITVHCSAGIGRTGTIILTLFLLRQREASGAIEPRKALQTLRMGRGRLVENMEQYIFVHKLLNEILFGMKTTFPCDSFVREVEALRSSKAPDGTSLLNKQFKKIKDLPKDLTFKIGKDPACAYLNRNQAILPEDKRMVFVQMGGQGVDAQYLNVININGFDRKDAYLAGEHPQPHTLAKMWRLVFDHPVSVWLMLQQLPPNDPSFPDVVGNASSLPTNMKVTASRPQHFDNFVEYSVSITVKELGISKSRQCTLLMLKGWSHAATLPPSPAALLGAIEKAESQLLPKTHLLFTCSDGVTGCGVMAALLLAVSRAKLTQEVDLYRSVVSVQYDRPQFIIDFEQYQFLHTAMIAFLDTNKHYGNFA